MTEIAKKNSPPIEKRTPGTWLKVKIFYPWLNDRYYRHFLNKNRTRILKRNVLYQILPGERILIMAPHMDDEILGCGGALIQYVAHGKDVHIVYLTDGSKRGYVKDRKSIPRIRKQEAESMAHRLNIPRNHLHFLEGRDGELKDSGKEGDLYRILDRIRPDTIFLPLPLDTHVDHIASSALLLSASQIDESLKRELLAKTTVYFYDVQSPLTQLYSNVTLDTESQESLYRTLLADYPSQGDLSEFGLLLHRYYGVAYGLKSAEAFLKISFPAFYRQTFVFQNNFETDSKDLLKITDPVSFIKSFQSSLNLKKKLFEYRRTAWLEHK